MFCKKFFSRKGKKGILALDSLLSLILSVIAFVLLLFIIYKVFIVDPDQNLLIAKDNAMSIKDFVNSYKASNQNSPYYNFKDCFFTLKLNNLENFQKQAEGKSFSYFIDGKGVYVVDVDKLEIFDKTRNVMEMSPEKFYFEDESSKVLNIKNDETDDGWFSSIDLFFVFSIGGFDNLKLESVNFPLIYLSQKKNILGNGFDNQNFLTPSISYGNPSISDEIYSDYKGGIPEGFEILDEGNSLVFSPNFLGEENILFVSENEVSNLYVRNNLCAKKFLSRENRVNSYKNSNIESLDYFNLKFTFSCNLEKSSVNLVWDKEFKCEGDDGFCSGFFNEFNGVSKNDFWSLFKDVKKDVNTMKDSNNNKFMEYCVKYAGSKSGSVMIKDESKKIIDPNFEVEFDLAFNKLDFDNSVMKRKYPSLNKITDLNNNQKEELFILDFGSKINSCSKYEDFCEEMYGEDGDIYFYVKDSNPNKLEWYSVSPKILRKEAGVDGRVNLYFLGESVSFKKISVDTIGWAPSKCDSIFSFCTISSFFGGSNDDMVIYKIQLKERFKDLDSSGDILVFMSPKQFSEIPQFDENLEVKIN